jgi:hypothetical protein
MIAGTVAMYYAVYTGGPAGEAKVYSIGFTLVALLAVIQLVCLLAALRHLGCIWDSIAGRERSW